MLQQDPGLDTQREAMSVALLRSMPKPTTPLIGREQERQDLAQLLTAPGARLVTVTGPGGIGKTRLAIATAEDIAGHFDGGTVFVDLSPVSDAAMVMRTIADSSIAMGTKPTRILRAFCKNNVTASWRSLLLHSSGTGSP